MTVPATTRRAGPFNGNGAATSFPFTFKVFAATDLQVTFTSVALLESVLVLNSDYSVTLNPDQDASPGGSVTYPISGTPLAAGQKLTVIGALEYAQPTDLPTGGAYRASTVEDALDRATIQIQQVAEGLGRALTLPPSAAAADSLLPAPEAGQVIGWNSSANALVNYDPASLATVVVAGSSYTDVFDGDGVTVAFALTADPGSVNALDIAISGVSQVNGIDFTVSGTTLTFTAAPPAGTDNVAVRYVVAVPVGGANAQDVIYNPAGAATVPTTAEAALNYTGYPSVFRWLTAAEIADVQAGTTGVDLRVKLQASQDANIGPIWLPPGVYGVGSEVVVKDGCGFIGANAFWRTRSGYVYDPATHSVIKYIGAGGTNTCVVRASNKAVGVEGTDFNATGDGVTDDLTSIVLQNFTIDANALADIGLYVYRAGNQSNVSDITAMRAVKYNHVHLGCYSGRFGHFGAYGGLEHGVAIGWDIFGWVSVESTNFAYAATFHTVGNGTNGTYVKGTATDLDGSGGRFAVGRGSHVRIISEGNDGRACLLSQYNVGGATAGPSTYELVYLEGNGDGPYIEYKRGFDHMRVKGGFVHPGNGASLQPQDITIEAKTDAGVVTTDEGPLNTSLYLVLEGLTGESTIPTNFDVKSNTTKYIMRDCSRNVGFTNRLPEIDDFVATDAQITTCVYFDAMNPPTTYHSKNGTLTRTSTGAYTFTFDRAFRVASTQIPHLNIVQSATLDTQVRINNITTGLATIRTYNGAGVLADTGDRIAFSLTGALEYAP